jgi:hypothetical protein
MAKHGPPRVMFFSSCGRAAALAENGASTVEQSIVADLLFARRGTDLLIGAFPRSAALPRAVEAETQEHP